MSRLTKSASDESISNDVNSPSNTDSTSAEQSASPQALDAVGIQASCAAPAPTQPPKPPVRRLRGLAMSGSIWTLIGFFSERVVRLISNLILTRLLFPSAFGLMALVMVVFSGVQMLSETGVSASIIQNKDGGSDRFINTAWTVRVIRGFMLWGALCILAYPLAMFYDQPELTWLIIVSGLSCVIDGFQSTGLMRLNRQVALKPIVLRDVATQAIRLAVIIPWALMAPSVWVLVGGLLIATAGQTALSFYLTPGSLPRFEWDHDAAKRIFHFGKWLFFSTAIAFFMQRGDSAVLGKYVSAAELGIYSIAAFWSRSIIDLLLRINQRVMFPLYARLANYSPEKLRSRVLHARLALLGIALPILWALVFGGDWMISLLYDPRYAEAGWILSVLACGTIAQAISLTSGIALLAVGDSRSMTVVQVVRGSALIAGMIIGGELGGFHGIVIGIAISKFFDYPVLAWAVSKYKLWMPSFDLALYAASLGIVALRWLVF